MTTSYVVLGTLFIGLIVVGFFSGRVDKAIRNSHFLIAHRQVGAFLVAIGLIMGWTDAGVFSFTGGLIMDGGLKTMLVFIGAEIVAFGVLSIYVSRIRKISEEKEMFMMSDIIRSKYSTRTAILSGMVTFIYFFLWMLVQFLVGADILHSVFNISVFWSAVLMGLVTYGYLYFGGFRSQIFTDVVQFVFLFAFMVVISYYYGPSVTEWAPVAIGSNSGIASSLLALFIITASSTIAAPDVWQRIYSAKSERAARQSMFLCAGIIVIVNSFFAGIGLIAKANDWATGANDLTGAVFAHMIPTWFLPFGLAVFFSLVLSTVATTLFGSGMAIVNDIAYSLKKVNSLSGMVSAQKILMFVLVFVAVLFSMSKLDLVSIVFYSFIICLIPLPVIISFFWDKKLHEHSVFWGMVAGFIVYISGIAFGFLDGIGALWPLIVELPVLFVIEWLERINENKKNWQV